MSDDAPLTITLKGGAGYAEPWIVIRAEDVEVARQNLEALIGSEIFPLTREASAAFILGATSAPPENQAAPAPYVVPTTTSPLIAAAVASATLETKTDQWGSVFTFAVPGAPSCPHGPRVKKDAVSKAGKPYTAWVCSVPVRDYKNKTECAIEYAK